MTTDPLLLVPFAIGGAVLGFVADAISRRWPAHEDGYATRGILSWRTGVLALTGAIAFGGLAAGWAAEPRDLVILFVYFVVLLVLLATDLDQRLLPDLLTLPLIVFSAAVLLLGWSPLLADRSLGLASGIAAGVGAPALLWIGDRVMHGDLGGGDLKLAVSIGLMSGVSQLFLGLIAASIGFSVALLALMAVKKLGLKSAVPFGPMLIFAAYVAALVG
jgi:leader peptidase (prepilin peptidase)/N-methyltransferase